MISLQVNFDDEIAPQNNELLKFTMCLLPSNIEPKDLIASLPHDVEALVILSTESRKNLSGELRIIFAVVKTLHLFTYSFNQ